MEEKKTVEGSSSPLGSAKASPRELMSAAAVTGPMRPAVIITEKGCWGQTVHSRTW